MTFSSNGNYGQKPHNNNQNYQQTGNTRQYRNQEYENYDNSSGNQY